MKRRTKARRILLLVAAVLVALPLAFYAYLYTGALGYEPLVNNEEIELYGNALTKRAFVGRCAWDGTDGAEIVIPDEMNGYRITAIGGFYGRGVPTPFCVTAPKEWNTRFDSFIFGGKAPEEETEYPNAEVTDCTITLVLGKYLKEINGVALGSYVSADGQQALRLRWYVTCDEENKVFYAENGHLYRRDTGETVDDLLYWDE